MSYLPPYASDQPLRANIRQHYLADETKLVNQLFRACEQSKAQATQIEQGAEDLVRSLREAKQSAGLIDSFLQEFSLSSEEGIVLMCLAEALLRIPDADTADALIRDKLTAGDWEAHIGNSDSLLVNASTWGMLLTGRWVSMDDDQQRDPFSFIKRLVAKSGEPAIRQAVRQAMKIMGHQFVLAESIEAAVNKAQRLQDKGFSYSYDMLGEAACTEQDAERYTLSYQHAITILGNSTADKPSASVVDNPGISIKLSALHSRYEFAKVSQVETELYQRLLALAVSAKQANLGFNLDAEEADRLELSLSLFEKLAHEPQLANWEGLGFVVQAYQKRALPVIEWLADLAQRSKRRFMLRLVKGAYWDSEIKHAQTEGHSDYPVFTRKENTDLSYLVCAQALLAQPEAFYPQFATHNARTVASILAYASESAEFEFQCLHGMGEALYSQLIDGSPYRCRIYAPVGEHKQLLAYLVRRLLENGANTSFVNLLANKEAPVKAIIADPLAQIESRTTHRHPSIALPSALFGTSRPNSNGMNLADSNGLDDYFSALREWQNESWHAKPIIAQQQTNTSATEAIINPASNKPLGTVQAANPPQIEAAIDAAQSISRSWDALGGNARATMLEEAAALYDMHRFELMALCQLEAGKTLADAIAEVREAIDFLRYYTQQARLEFSGPQELLGPTGEKNEYQLHGRGVFACISPWNFPLAIFTGQVAAALAAGNCVLAKPAEQTPLIAWRAVHLLLEAGVPAEVLQLLPGSGGVVGAALSNDPRVDGVVFTGGTDTARLIHQSLSNRPNSPLPHLIAETGGLNAMIVDSSALPEQVVQDVVSSAFQSAGQRCSALRVLYLQNDIADELIDMIAGAMAELKTGDPSQLSTDVGPIIDTEAQVNLQAHLDQFEASAVIARAAEADGDGSFFQPTLLQISGIEALEKEVFGPILHVARFKASELDAVIESINASGYGLTLGIHSRIESNIERVRNGARVGNLYVNRNIIGAVVGVQPFGGEGLSGTGPKAGGPHYLHRFAVERVVSTDTTAAGGNASLLTLG